MAPRSRKRRAASAASAQAPSVQAQTPPKSARSEIRNAKVRAQLEPLAPGERPPAVTVAAVVALSLAIVNLALFTGGYRVKSGGSPLASLIVFELLLLTAAAGLWKARYWAVLGFEALLGLIVVYSTLFLVVASNLAAVALCLGTAIPAGALFYKLIRAMARIQTPPRPSRT